MNLVKKRSDIVENLIAIEKMLASSKKEEREFAANQVLNDTNVIIYKSLGENHFGPCSFLGVKKCSIEEHSKLTEADIKDITKAVTAVIGRSFANETTNEKFRDYAVTIDKKIPKIDRTYWRIKDERGKNLNLSEKDLK
jgi:hypothetical protein